jgi:hypothetical protein
LKIIAMHNEWHRIPHAKDAGIESVFRDVTIDLLVPHLQEGQRLAFLVEVVGVDGDKGAASLG